MDQKNNHHYNVLTNIFILLLAVFLPFFTSGCKRHPSPNIVLIIIDTMRADHLPFYGYKKQDTAPFMTTLAQQGTVFLNPHAPSSWTAPATASIHTGLYPFQHGVTMGLVATRNLKTKAHRIPDNITTIAEMLKQKGYGTFGISCNLNICELQGFHQGFDKFKWFYYRDERKMQAQLFDWIDEIKKQERYFLYIHYNDPHDPYHTRAPWYVKGENKEADDIARYDSEINYVDAKINEVFQRLQMDRDTLIIITGDHGESFGEHYWHKHGWTLYREEIMVPLVFYFPQEDRRAGQIAIPVTTVDIFPTIREYLGIDAFQPEAGLNLMPLIKGEEPSEKFKNRDIFSHLQTRNLKVLLKATISGGWKSIYDEKQKRNPELFHIQEDPLEKKNLYKKETELFMKLRQIFLDFEKRCKKFEPQIKKTTLSDEKKKELKTLGYVQ